MAQPSSVMVMTWFLAAILVIALAGPFPQAATLLLVIILFLVLVKNWKSLANYMPQPSGGQNGSI